MALTFSDRAIIILTYLLISVLGMAGIWYLYLSLIGYSPPIVWEKSTIKPVVVRAGDTIVIGRTYTVTRQIPVMIVRTLEQTNCSKDCIVYSLPQTQSTRRLGSFDNMLREHVMPPSAKPGTYEFRFQMMWQNELGKWYAEDMQPLRVTVIP